MSLSLLWPAGLLAALAVLVPLLLHRLPRRQSRPRSFAALRFIGQHGPPRQQKRISEWPLLVLRLCLLALLALWLAGPRWLDWPGRGLHWRAVWPGVDAAALASLPPADRSLWLAPGLAETTLGPAPTDADEALSLLRQLAAELPPGDRLSVVVPQTLHGLDDNALVLARQVDWIPLPGGPAPREATPPLLAIRGAPPERWLEAAIAAWETDPELAARIDAGDAAKPIPSEADALLSIGAAPPDRLGMQTPPALIIPDNADTAGTEHVDALSGLPWVALPDGSARLYGPLNPATMPQVLDPDFPRRLHRLIFQREAAPGVAPAGAVSPQLDATLASPAPLDLRDLLALVAALLFLFERWLASGRRLAQGAG